MSTPATAAPAAAAAFTELIDYAGLFPPAKLEMAAALAEYGAESQGRFSWMLGRFIVQASRIPELLAALPAAQPPLALSVILDAGSDGHVWLGRVQSCLAQLRDLRSNEPRIRIEALEIALPPLQMQRESYDAAIGQFSAAVKQALMDSLPAFVEFPRDARRIGELDGAVYALARYRLGAKLRCGGLDAAAFPSPQEVALFIRACADHGVPMKATAGLHHPVRHGDEDLGVTRHGFLNLLAAAALAREGMDKSALERVIACEDAAAFSFAEDGLSFDGKRVSVDELRGTRSLLFISYGSCSFTEPVADLGTLGIL